MRIRGIGIGIGVQIGADQPSGAAAPPTLSSIAPSSKHQSDAPFTLTATGTDFTASSVIRIDGAPVATSFGSATSLTCTVDPSTLTTASHDVDVTDTTGTSSTQTLAIDHAAPTLSNVSPSTVTIGSGATAITCTGTGFDPSTVIYSDATPLATTYVSATQVTATLTSGIVNVAGAKSITAVNPTPGGGTSGAQTCTVQHAAPTLTSISPSTATLGSGATVITCTGTGFDASTVIYSDATALATTFVSATQVTATLTAGIVNTAGLKSITAQNPTPGGGTSGAKTFSVPGITSLSSATVERWDAAFTQTINGAGFVNGCTVQLVSPGTSGTTSPAVTFVSSSQLTIPIADADLDENGTATVKVTNPGGGASNTQNLTITQPAATDLFWEVRADKGRTMNGGTVQGLADQSLAGDANRNLAQVGTPSAQWTYVAGAGDSNWNNKDYFTLDGGDFEKTGAWSGPPGQPVHYFLACKLNTVTGNILDGIVTGNRNNVVVSTGSVSMNAGTTISCFANTGNPRMIVQAQFNGASSKYSKNAKTLTTTSSSPGTGTITGLTVGANFAGNTFQTGELAQIIVVNPTTMAAKLGRIADYMGRRYNQAIAA